MAPDVPMRFSWEIEQAVGRISFAAQDVRQISDQSGEPTSFCGSPRQLSGLLNQEPALCSRWRRCGSDLWSRT